MGDEADYAIETADAGASSTIPMEAGQIKKGGYVLISIKRGYFVLLGRFWRPFYGNRSSGKYCAHANKLQRRHHFRNMNNESTKTFLLCVICVHVHRD